MLINIKNNYLKPIKELNVQKLYDPSIDSIENLVNTKENTFIKVKVGRIDPNKELSLLNDLSQNPLIKIRLDSNQSWKLSEAIEFLKKVPKNNIEYLEEPLKNPNELEILHKKTGFLYALDESILSFKNKKLTGLHSIVLKPTLLGSYFDLIEIIRSYKENHNNLNIVLSSSFETTIGMEFIKKIAHHISPKTYHGLDTDKYIKRVEYVEN